MSSPSSITTCPIWNQGTQFYDKNGNKLVFGQIYAYAGNSWTVQQEISGGSGPITQPVVFDQNGINTTEILLEPNVYYNLKLLDQNGLLVDVQENVLGLPSFFLTSQIYPIDVIETLFQHGNMVFAPAYFEREFIRQAGVLTSGTLVSSLVQYTNGLPESINQSSDLTSGTFVSALVQYTNGLPESINQSSDLTSGTFVNALVQYNNYVPEALTQAGNLTSGSLV